MIPVLVYDKDCGICDLGVRWLKAHYPDPLEYRGGYSPDLEAFGITATVCSRYVVLITTTGPVLGADAILTLLMRIFKNRLSLRILSNAPAIWVLRLFYRLLASQRRRISLMLGLNACEI